MIYVVLLSETTMPPPLPKSHKDAQRSVLDLLRNSHHFWSLFTADVVANLLNIAAEIEDSTVPRFTKDIVTAAFLTEIEKVRFG